MKKITFKRILSIALAICVMASIAVPTFATELGVVGTNGQNGQRTTGSTIDTSLTGSIELYKIDFTNAEKDGVWNNNSYISTGIQDDYVNKTLITDAQRAGDSDGVTDLDNGGKSNGYAIAGVEFTYLKVADIVTYTEAENGSAKVMVLYGFAKDDALLGHIGLTVDNRYVKADGMNGDENVVYFESHVLVNALKNSLMANATSTKNLLEAYIVSNNGVAMPLTDENGYSKVDNLPLGLYLLVETNVPEMVTNTVNPFFVSLPMTTVDGTNSNVAEDGIDSNGKETHSTDGGASWLYDVTLYPKNETGIPSLEKTVREAMSDTGENQGLISGVTSDLLAIKDGYKHYATASSGDILEYQIISTLPSITSDVTGLRAYNITDVLCAGMTYVGAEDVVIEWYRDENCTDKITTWELNNQFKVEYQAAGESAGTSMLIKMTDAGLSEINSASTVWHVDGVDSQVRRGYSDCTMRITYRAKFNSDASVNFGDMGNDNKVVLTWQRKNAAHFDTLIDDAHVYTYGIDLTKVFADENDARISGDFGEVEFVVWNASDGYWVKAELNAEEGIYYVTDHLVEGGIKGHDDGAQHADLTAQKASESANATKFVPVTTGSAVNADAVEGRVIIKGLEDDTYIITEIRTANGFTLLKNHITVTITARETDELCTVYETDLVGVIQNDPRYASIVNADNVDTILGLGGVNADNDTQTGQNITQDHLAHYRVRATATVDDNAVTMTADENGASTNALAPLTVVNTQGFDLPQTGEMGIILMPLFGAVGIGLCLICLFVLRKKEKRESAG